jgi:hypothetical protein
MVVAPLSDSFILFLVAQTSVCGFRDSRNEVSTARVSGWVRSLTLPKVPPKSTRSSGWY